MNLHELFGKRAAQYRPDDSRWPDLFGIELELEGVFGAGAIPYWNAVPDGSLRDGIEYVTDAPYGGPTLEAAIKSFYDADVKSESTERSSTHIHINMMDSTLDNLRSMIVIMYALESSLFAVVGEARKWCGYAMPLSEMESSRLTNILQATRTNLQVANIATGRNQDRYYGFNVASIRKHGTAEFRYFPGNPSKEELENWLDFVYAVKKASKQYTAAQLVERINTVGDMTAFVQAIMPPYWAHKLTEVGVPEEMFESFNAVAALATDTAELEARREPLVFLNETLLRFAKKRIVFDKAGHAYLDKIKEQLQVVTEGEWFYHIQEAKMQRAEQAAPVPDAAANPFRDLEGRRYAGIWVDEVFAEPAQDRPAAIERILQQEQQAARERRLEREREQMRQHIAGLRAAAARRAE